MSACKGSPAKHESLLEILANEACRQGAGTGEGLLLACFSSGARGMYACVRACLHACVRMLACMRACVLKGVNFPTLGSLSL